MEEDPLIPLVHVWNNAAFDSASAWRTHTAAASAAGSVGEGDKENTRPEPEATADVEAEIGHIEAEILRLSSRLHHLRTSKQPEPAKCGEAVVKLAPPAAKPAARPRTRGLSLGPLEVVAAAKPTPILEKVPAAAPQRKVQGEAGPARPILKQIKEPPVLRRRGVSLGPLEIHNGVGSKPGSAAAAAAAPVKPFYNKLSAVREEGQQSKQHAVPARPWPSSNARQPYEARQGTTSSRAKARSGSMSPRSRRQSTSKGTEARGGTAKATEIRGSNAAVAVNKVGDEVKAKGVINQTSNAATSKRPAGSSKVRVVPSRYSLTPGSSVAAGTQEKRHKQSVTGLAGGASQREEIRAKLTEPSTDEVSPETIAKVAELLPRIRTVLPFDESPRDSGCAKRVADLVGKRSFFTPDMDDGNAITPYQARVLQVESPEAGEEEEEEEA
ncbi:hypothetical protein HU200_043080 [Digitaria exilis]|uniref:Uncharacterized protein n=1 Tax=Digitaria exilis TaxID=1010633 RepID=A0A835B442_9POAL|nr:hypothetical protein HU200_043080 [Digitaria exilis]